MQLRDAHIFHWIFRYCLAICIYFCFYFNLTFFSIQSLFQNIFNAHSKLNHFSWFHWICFYEIVSFALHKNAVLFTTFICKDRFFIRYINNCWFVFRIFEFDFWFVGRIVFIFWFFMLFFASTIGSTLLFLREGQLQINLFKYDITLFAPFVCFDNLFFKISFNQRPYPYARFFFKANWLYFFSFTSMWAIIFWWRKRAEILFLGC